MFPLQGVPGAPELVVILLVLLVLTIPVLLAIGAGAVYFLFVRETDEEDDRAMDGADRAMDGAAGTPASAAGGQEEPDDEHVEESAG